MVSMAFAQQDTLQLVTQFDAHSLKIRWITTDVNALRRGFNEGWQLIIYPQNSNQPVYQERIRPLTDNALADLIHSGSDSLVFSIYQNIRSGQTFFTDAADREWQQLGFLFGLADNFRLSKALALGHEITGLDTALNYRVDLRPGSAYPALISLPALATYNKDPGLTPPPAPQAGCKDDRIAITATLPDHTPWYASYRLEKDTSGENKFFPLHTTPLLVNYASGQPRIFYLDSLPAAVTSYYRLVGKDIWGRYGPASAAAGVEPCSWIFTAPHPLEIREMPSGHLRLQWQLPSNVHPGLQGFHIYRSRERFGPFEQLNTALIPPADRFFVSETPWTVGYYYVQAVYSPRVFANSLTVLGTVLDVVPPAVPQHVHATLDTSTMIVTITWQPVEDRDLNGYRVSFAHGRTGHKFLLNNLETNQTSMQDTLGRRDLFTEIYYWVTARDHHQNESFYSDSAAVVLPDVFPPIPARITELEAETYGVRLYYDRSPSRDAERYLLQKRTPPDSVWTEISVYPTDWNNQFMDTVTAVSPWEYRLKTVDVHGLESFSEIRQAKLLDPYLLPPVEYTKAERQDSVITLYFDYPDHGSPARFRIMAGASAASLGTISLPTAAAITFQRGIRKRNSPHSYTLFKIQLPLTDPSWQFFKIRAMDAQGKISPYSKLFSY